jgi:AcrR family transcriptional regulator
VPKASAQQTGGTRERLVEAAAALVAEQGWSAVTTRAVAERAGVNPGLVHYHFDSIEDLRVTASTSAVERALDTLAGLQGGRSVVESLGAAIEAMIAETRDGPMAVLTAELLVRAGRDDRIRDWMAGLLARLRAELGSAIRGGIGRGELEPVDPEALAVLLAAIVDGLLLHVIADPGLPIHPALDTLGHLVRADRQEHP